MEVKTKGNTTNLRNHLLRRHPLIKTVSQKKKNDSGSRNTQNGDGSGQVSESDATLDNIADSRNVDNSDTENKGVKTGQINNAIVFMIAKDGLPLNTVEKTGFNYLIKTVAPLCKIPARKTMTYMIDDKYDVLSSQLKLKIEEVEALSLTADVWTDPHNSQSYMGLTGHFIHENKMMSIVFGVSALTEPHNSEYLAHVITMMADKWNIKSDKVIAFITDNGANIVKAVTIVYGKNKHIPCFAHTLNLVASKPFDNKDGLEEAKNLLTAVKEITTYFKQNTNAADSLKKAQEHKAKPLTLIRSVCTRWNSVFYQLERFVDLSEIIAPILLKYPKAPTMLTAGQLEHIKDLINILRPLERITKEISGQNYVTVSKIIPIVSCLTETYNAMRTSTDVGAKIKTWIVEGLKKRFGSVEKVHLLAAATILDPRFEKIHFTDYIACSRAIDRINTLILDVQSQQQVPQDNRKENQYEEENDAEK
nr:E3 SUMO-protein ligase ZBED1-like [Neodiprion pinetum]